MQIEINTFYFFLKLGKFMPILNCVHCMHRIVIYFGEKMGVGQAWSIFSIIVFFLKLNKI